MPDVLDQFSKKKTILDLPKEIMEIIFKNCPYDLFNISKVSSIPEST